MNSHRENPPNPSDRDDAVTDVRMISSEPFFRGERFRRFRHVDTGPFVLLNHAQRQRFVRRIMK